MIDIKQTVIYQNDLELIPEDVRNNASATEYTKIALNNLIEYKFVRDPQTKEWIKYPQSKIDELNKERQTIKPPETYEERMARLEKARLRREAKQKAEEDYDDFLDFDDFDNEEEIAKAEALLRLLKDEEALDSLDKED